MEKLKSVDVSMSRIKTAVRLRRRVLLFASRVGSPLSPTDSVSTSNTVSFFFYRGDVHSFFNRFRHRAPPFLVESYILFTAIILKVPTRYSFCIQYI